MSLQIPMNGCHAAILIVYMKMILSAEMNKKELFSCISNNF